MSCYCAQITDSMFAAAAQKLADYVPVDRIEQGDLYPELENLRDISLKVQLSEHSMGTHGRHDACTYIVCVCRLPSEGKVAVQLRAQV